MPLRGSDGQAGDEPQPLRFAGSPYARTERLARRLTAGAPTAYDAVRRVQDHFRSGGFTYSERPPSRRYPLDAFLFQDRIGYCQQFSGAMALMLRMAGIPARVATGFSPGSLNRDTGEYRVRDLDAHSWVEVYFNGIGWVTFDPTPPAAPADRAGQGPRAAPEGEDRPARRAVQRRRLAALRPRRRHRRGRPRRRRRTAAAARRRGCWSASRWLALGGAAWCCWPGRRLRPHGTAEAGLAELQQALPRLGWKLPAGTTLLQLEQRLRRAAGPASARYVGQLRTLPLRPRRSGAPPPAGNRRAMRRELTAGGGLSARLRGFVALPPRRSHG